MTFDNLHQCTQVWNQRLRNFSHPLPLQAVVGQRKFLQHVAALQCGAKHSDLFVFQTRPAKIERSQQCGVETIAYRMSH